MEEPIIFKNKTNIFLRIIYFPLVQIIIAIILVNVPTFILRSFTQFILSTLSVENSAVTTFIIFLVRILTVYFAYTLFCKFFEKRKAQEISINIKSVKEFIYGAIFGLIGIVIILMLMWILGNFTISGINDSATLFQGFLHNFFYAFLQDVVYYAIIFRILEKWIGSWSAVVFTSIIFGFKHLLFPDYTLWSVIAQSFEAGILFSTLYIFSRNIWLIFGFHAVWNFIEYGLIQGFGDGEIIPLFISEYSGSTLITGMPVGPEASILTFVILTSAGIYFIVKTYKTGKFIFR